MLETIAYLFRLIFFLDDPVGAVVNWIIVISFGVGVADVLSSRKRLIWERMMIRQAASVLETDRQRCPSEPAELVVEFLELPAHSLLAERVARVVQLRSAGLGSRDVLRRLTGERLDGYGALARFIAMTLTLVGLLGTVYGLSVAVGKTQLVISQEVDFNALRDLAAALGGTLGGMKTAFATTLTGLLTALLLSVANHFVRGLQSQVAAQLEAFVTCGLVPALDNVDPEADAAAKVFANTLRKAAGQLRKVSDGVTKAAGVYGSSGAELKKAAGEIAGAASSFKGSLEQLAGDQRQFTEAVTNADKTISAVGTVVRQECKDLRELTESSRKLLQDRLEKMERQSTDVHQLGSNLKRLAGDFTKVASSLDQHFSDALQTVKQELEATLNRVYDDVRRRDEKALEGYLQSAQGKLDKVLSGYTSAFGKKSQEALGKLDELLSEHRAAMARLVNGSLGDHHTAFNAVSDMVLDMNQNVGTLLDKLVVHTNRHAPQEPDHGVS